MRNTPLLRPGWWDINWKLTVHVSHWLPNCTGRTVGADCAFSEASWRCRYDNANKESFWPGISYFWAPNVASAVLTNSSRSLLSICTDPAAGHVNSRYGLTKENANADCLFLHFAVITVALRWWRSTNTRSILTADWVRRKELVRALTGLLLEDKSKMLNANTDFQSDQLSCFPLLKTSSKMWRLSEWRSSSRAAAGSQFLTGEPPHHHHPQLALG